MKQVKIYYEYLAVIEGSYRALKARSHFSINPSLIERPYLKLCCSSFAKGNTSSESLSSRSPNSKFRVSKFGHQGKRYKLPGLDLRVSTFIGISTEDIYLKK